MFKWEKLGLLFDPAGRQRPAWMDGFAQAPNVIIHENFVRVYFCCRPKPDAGGMYVSYSAYADLNRKNLFEITDISKEPALELGETGDFDEFGTYPVSVIRHNDEIRAYYGGWTRCESVPFDVAIGCAVSRDGGVKFEKVGRGPVLSYSPGEPFVVTSPKVRIYGGKWYLFYTAGKKWMIEEGRPEIIYQIRMATSIDGINWEKANKNLLAPRLGEDEAQACPDVFFKNGKYHMFFCYRHATDFRRNRERSYRIGYAVSTDLLNWSRDDSKAGIDVSPEGWDSEMVAYPTVFEVDRSIYMIYLGNQVGKSGMGLAKLSGSLP